MAFRAASAALIAMLLAPGLGGCKRSALRADDERSQFTRYDRTRNADASPFIEDEYGRRTPNLRGRLLVND